MNKPQLAKIRIAAKQADTIQMALRASINVDKITNDWVNANPAGGTTSTSDARTWTRINVIPQSDGLRIALRKIYGIGYVFGVDAAHYLIKRAKTHQKAIKPNVGVVDWATWKPGNRAAGALLKPSGGLQTLLDSRNVAIMNINSTTLDRIGTILGRALTEGIAPRQVSILIDQLLDDPARSMVIAQTEMSRAVCVASMEIYGELGVEYVEWLVAEGCDDCQENADASPIPFGESFPSGDTEPPAHPNCMCDISPYVVDTQNVFN